MVETYYMITGWSDPVYIQELAIILLNEGFSIKDIYENRAYFYLKKEFAEYDKFKNILDTYQIIHNCVIFYSMVIQDFEGGPPIYIYK